MGDLRFLVLDEADKLFEKGRFLETIMEVYKACDSIKVVRCLFGATLPQKVYAYIKKKKEKII